jgi:eukaryotic-like serine/threonine-protein kinase
MRPQVGQVINNKYRLVRLIGDGGMGSVYEARHEVLGTSVALKFLHPELARRQGLVQRFLQEAKVSAQIQSPHVVRVTDVDQNAAGQAFIVLELLDGRTLQTLYEDLYREGRRLSYADALEYAMQMLEGVEAAHRTGIVHRDLKPDNVMVTQGPKGAPVLKLLDFGIAKLKVTGELDRGLTRPGVIMGTPEYMAPEQAYSADAVDARADIFSLGVIIFEMLAGQRPVGGDDPQQIASAYIAGQVAKLGDLVPGVAPALAAAVHQAMAAQPKDRFASVAEFRDALEPFAHAVRTPHPSNPGVGLTPAPAGATPNTPAPHSVNHAPPPAAVPKTIPPEGDGAQASPQGGGFSVPATNMWSRDATAPVASGNPYPAGAMPPGMPSPSPGLATTETNPPYQPAGGGAGYGNAAALSPRPSGTAIGAAYGGLPGGPGGTAYGGAVYGGPPAYGGAGTAPMSQPYAPMPVTAPSGDMRRHPAKGTSLALILLLAIGVTGVVVGGVYAASRLSSSSADKGDISIIPPPITSVAADPPLPVGQAPITTPVQTPKTPVGTPPKPPGTVVSKPPTTGPGSSPTAQPTTQPTSTVPILPSVPWVIPTSLPPFPPFGQAQTPSPQPQDPNPGGAVPPAGGGVPSGGTQPTPGSDSPAPTDTGRRPGIILRPRR